MDERRLHDHVVEKCCPEFPPGAKRLHTMGEVEDVDHEAQVGLAVEFVPARPDTGQADVMATLETNFE